MDRKKLLQLGIAVAALPIVIVATPAFAEAGCSTTSSWVGGCTGAQTNSGSVDVWGNRTTPGETSTDSSSGSSGSSGGTASGSGWVNPADVPYSLYPKDPRTISSYCELSNYFGSNLCPAGETQPSPTPVKPAAPVTISDLANFTPQQPSLSMQPNGWTVLGVETNLIAATAQHVVAGRLFGGQAEVRFTPQGFDWNYGDGFSASTSSAGATWAALGVKDFARTATSHRYLSLGTFNPTVTVRFGVEYRVGGGAWIPVRGQVSAQASASTVIVYSADTVLVTGSCTPNRPAPGC